jgi:protein SCO1/2
MGNLLIRHRSRVPAALWLVCLLGAAAPAAFGQGPARYKRTVETYTLPDVVLVSQTGFKVRLADLVNSDKPVLLNFAFATCTTICPVMSAGFANLQRKLGAETANVRLISISIDPENDTPEVLKQYLDRYGAKPGWDFYTGRREDILSIMKACNALVPDKMQHQPLTFLKAPGDSRWIRIHGLIGTADLLAEYRQVAKR